MTPEEACEFIVEELAPIRQEFLDSAKKNNFNLDIFEDFYPDKAHFISELLQNAEDVKATETEFILEGNWCKFAHNGPQPFTKDDVDKITAIHSNTQTKNADQIGRFGIGFKSVYLYTRTPEVHSGPFSFAIDQYVLPRWVHRMPEFGDATMFVLPFDNPEKPPELALKDISEGLDALPLITLLFLKHVRKLRWQVPGRPVVELRRVDHLDHHVEMLKEEGGKIVARANFLKFSKAVQGIPTLKNQQVSLAFELEYRPSTGAPFKPDQPLADQLKPVEAHGFVAVFFPATKETSNLRFHLHAPFVPTPGRGAIKDNPANTTLIVELAELAVASLSGVKKLGLLNADFLPILPIKDDLLGSYEPIRLSVVNAMKVDELTPTQARGHAPAVSLVQARAAFKELISEDDLQFLLGPPAARNRWQWAVASRQQNDRADTLLKMLAIREWGLSEFISELENRAGSELDQAFHGWLSGKPIEWFQELYVLLNRSNEEVPPEKLKPICFIKCGDGALRRAGDCYFPDPKGDQDPNFPCMAAAILDTKPKLKEFFLSVGVREADEFAKIEQMLKRHYWRQDASAPSILPSEDHFKDIERFAEFAVADPKRAAQLFKDYKVFHTADGVWAKPSQVFLDAPYKDTGLSVFYSRLGEKAALRPLSISYKSCRVDLKRLAALAEIAGAVVELKIEKCRCWQNPNRDKLVWYTSRAGCHTDEDYNVPHLAELLQSPDIKLSRLVWDMLQRQSPYPDWTKARYSPAQKYPPRTEASQLTQVLQNSSWVPQQVDGSVTFSQPAQASAAALPDGFAYDRGWPWLAAIGFGQRQTVEVETANEQLKVAQELGFKDPETLEHAKLFASLPDEVRNDFLMQRGLLSTPELPNDPNPNPERRRAKVQNEATKAPKRRSEVRDRSVSIGIDDVKKAARTYLRDRYTNRHGTMICQVCQGRSPLPFRLPDGEEYFEAVEFLGREVTSRHLRWNYIALCPTHAAMFQHANESKDDLERLFRDANADDEGRYFVPVKLARQELTIYFNGHWGDLRAALDTPDDHPADGEEE